MSDAPERSRKITGGKPGLPQERPENAALSVGAPMVRDGNMALADELSLDALSSACRTIFEMRLPEAGRPGWGVRMRERFGYYTPDEVYEAILLSLVRPGIDWLDVGCGHELFPSNRKLAQVLSARCGSLTGIDPDPAIHPNSWLHHREQCGIEDFETDRRFDLVSMRMVAEHIADPDATVAKFGSLARPGGRVVVYTVSRWAPVSLLAAATPTSFHRAVKRAVWNTPDDDTFPTLFKMNTRAALRRVFGAHGFPRKAFCV